MMSIMWSCVVIFKVIMGIIVVCVNWVLIMSIMCVVSSIIEGMSLVIMHIWGVMVLIMTVIIVV